MKLQDLSYSHIMNHLLETESSCTKDGHAKQCTQQ